MPLRALFLDVGHTLLREEPSRYAIYAEVAAGHGIEIDSRDMKREMRRAHDALPRILDGAFRYSDPWFRAFVARIFRERLGLPSTRLEAVTAELFARFEDAATFRLYPGARTLLAASRGAGLVVGVISNWSARLPRVLRALEIDAAFDFVLCSAIERVEKPEPAIFSAALERAGVAPGEALHAGDHLVRDVQGALAAGLAAVLVDHTGVQDDPPAGALRVTGLDDLRRVILDRA